MDEGLRVLFVGTGTDLPEASTSLLAEKEPDMQVCSAETADKGIQKLTDSTACVVSAQTLPTTSGIAFLESVRGEYPDLPLVLYADNAEDLAVRDAISAGVTDIVPGGVDADESELLKARIRSALESREIERDLQQYRTLVETVGDPMYILDETGDVEFVNEAMLEFLETTREAVLGRNVGEMIPDSDFDAGTARLQEILDSSEQEWGLYEITVFTDTGTRKHAECNMAPLVEHGKLVGSVGVFRDITERKHGQEALQALHEVATTIQTEDSVDAVCEQTVAAASEILDFALCSIVIREGDWLVPYAISEDAPPDGSRPMRVDQGLAGETYQTQEPTIVEQVTEEDGSDPAKDSYRSAISVPVGDHGVFQAVSTETEAFDDEDIEFAELLLSHAENAIDRLERRKELERQNDRLEEFASVVSHDLRNPLNVADTRLELLRDEYSTEHIDAIESAHDRMATLIEDLLTLAMDGKTVSEFESVDLVPAVQRCWQTVSTGELTLAMETDISIKADPSRLKQLLENLFRNAVEHAGEDVTVTVGELPRGDGFFVADDGRGIDSEDRAKVLNSGYSTSEDGTGFGLAIVAEIASAHGWSVTVTESVGGGARFEFADVDVETKSE